MYILIHGMGFNSLLKTALMAAMPSQDYFGEDKIFALKFEERLATLIKKYNLYIASNPYAVPP